LIDIRLISALEVNFNVMRSINSRFTYFTFTYLLYTVCGKKIDHAAKN